MTFVWGTEIHRRAHGSPCLLHTPRRTRLPQLLADAGRWSDRVHLVQGARRLTYADVLARIESTAALLAARGVRPGDRVLILAPNSPEWIVAKWAAFRLGAVASLGNGW